jgi:uncharacterized protein (DUF3084 family)
MFENPIVVIFICLAGMSGLLWSARRYDGIHKRVKEQQDRAGEQQQKADELQQRAIQILDREDAVLVRAEELLDRIENKLLS